MLKKYFFLVFLFFVFGNLKAEYTVTANCSQAWEALLNLNTITAKRLIEKEIRENPKNYYAYYLAQTCDAFALKINGSDEMYEQFVEDFEMRRDIMDDKDTDSPYYHYCESEMLLQMAVFNVLHGDKLSGVRKGYRAYKTLYENIDQHPDFIFNNKLDGFFNVALSNLPPFVKWAASTFGISGTSKKGFELLNEYYNKVKDEPGVNAEAALYMMLSYKLNKEPKNAFEFISQQDSSITERRIIKYFYANTAYRSGLNELAYNSLLKFNPGGMEMDFIAYDYMMGKILLRKLDAKSSTHFERYLELSIEDNYKKEITYKLALSYLVRGDENKFKFYRDIARDQGEEITERDREAGYDCELKYTPDISLTKSKLLLEGGYFNRFEDNMSKFSISQNTPLPYQLEYWLLSARYNLHQEQFAEAETALLKVIEKGKNEDYYFAAEAALLLGTYYREKNNPEEAKKYLDLCLNLYESEYYEYIEEMAKRELKKIESKS
jgi:hypothetical protein